MQGDRKESVCSRGGDVEAGNVAGDIDKRAAT